MPGTTDPRPRKTQAREKRARPSPPKPMEDLHDRISRLINDIDREGLAQAADWSDSITRADFEESAANLARYLSLRRRDLRPLQRELMALGLSSLGRVESRVSPALLAVEATLAGLSGLPAKARPLEEAFFAGERLLDTRTRELFGPAHSSRPTALLVTCPTKAAVDPEFMLELAKRGVEAVRINCAHDDADHWERMIRHTRTAEEKTGHRLKILMDLAGPKIRTGAVLGKKSKARVGLGDVLAVVPPEGFGNIELKERYSAVECTLPEALKVVQPGHRLFIDDGEIGTLIEQVEPWGVQARVVSVMKKGARLKPEKGINLPDTDIDVPALTRQDITDLDFVAHHADGVSFSFVQSVDDVIVLQKALAERRPHDWQTLSLILKIETPRAVSNLPDIIVQAAGRQPAGIMIARGDLAVEIGFARLAEMQDEILWIGEAARVPVIWATQVLEHFVKKGTHSRGEMTDAAMAARSECVMLNKGPYLLEAIDMLDTLLERMDGHQHKKTPQLRRLQTW